MLKNPNPNRASLQGERRSRPRLLLRALAGLGAGALGVGLLAAPQIAHAAPGAASNFEVGVAFDGVAPFDGVDSGPSNGQVRTNDIVAYELTTTYAAAGDVIFESTLPVGMEWHASATNASICDGPSGGALSPDLRTWTCSHVAEVGIESFNVSAWVRTLGNGATVAPQFTVDTASGTAPTVAVVAETRTESRIHTDEDIIDYGFVHNGEPGIRVRVDVLIGATLSAGGYRGYESLQSPYEFTLQVPPTAVGLSATERLIGGGTRELTQTGNELRVTVTGADTDFRSTTISANEFASVSQTSVYFWMPYSSIPTGQITPVAGRLIDFDPIGLGGGSNFGSGYAPGLAPGYTCPADLSARYQIACFELQVDRTQSYDVRRVDFAAIHAPGQILLGDDHAYLGQAEKIVPGQEFQAISQIRNAPHALNSASNIQGCAVIDTVAGGGSTNPSNRLIELTGRAGLAISDAGGHSGGTYLWQGNDLQVLSGTGISIQYTSRPFSGDHERQNDYWCYTNSGDWSSNPESVAGGMSAVTAIRYTIAPSSGIYATPGRFIGLNVPLRRTTNAVSLALPVDTDITWRFRFETAEAGRRSMTAHVVQAVPALVRNTVAWNTSTISPGLINEVTVQPFVIGPAGGATGTVANDTRVTVDFGNGCASPVVASLDEWASSTGLTYTVTPAAVGADGLVCTADDTPAKVVFNLGDVAAPSGAAGGTFHAQVGGHETVLDSIAFQVLHAASAPAGSNQTVTATISSASDASEASWDNQNVGDASARAMDRRASDTVALTGAAQFNVRKSVTTAVDGVVSPAETFVYDLSWGNPDITSNGTAYFVDVLPFDEDGRGTVGLDGAGLEVVNVTAETISPSFMGTITIEHTIDDPADVLAAVQTPGNEGATSGVTWTTGPVPSNATALRFVTDEPLLSGYGGFASITVKAPGLTRDGRLVNDVYGRAEPDAGGSTAKVIIAQAPVGLDSSAGFVSGNVYRDLDFTGTITTAIDGGWPAGTGTVELVDGSTVLTSDITAGGAYTFAAVPEGTYTVRLSAVESSGWTQLLPSTTVDVDAGEVVTGYDALYQEALDAPELVDDAATVHAGSFVSIDVTDNDTLNPVTVGPESGHDGVGVGTLPTYGTVGLVAGSGGAQGTFNYTASATWPAVFDGVSSYDDTFTYTWTNVLGVSDSATVTVTVSAATGINDETVRIPDEVTLVDVLANDTGDGLYISGAPIVSGGDATVAVSGTQLEVTPSHTWAVDDLVHVVTVEYEVTDALDVAATATATITVQRPPLVTGGSVVIPVDASHTFNANPRSAGTLDAPATTAVPAAGDVVLTSSGLVTFDGDGVPVGTYDFQVTYLDDFGQEGVASFTVTVQVAPTAIGGTATIPLGGSHVFDATPTGTIASANVTVPPTDGEVTASTTGAVTFDGASAVVGTYPFTVRFTDGSGLAADALYIVTVQAPPVGAGESVTLPDDQHPHDFDVLARVTGTGLQAITSSDVAQPANGTVTVNTAGDAVTFVPELDYFGDTTFTVEVTDDLGQSVVLTYQVTILQPPAPSVPTESSGLVNTGLDLTIVGIASGILFLGGILLIVIRRIVTKGATTEEQEST